MNPTEEVQSTRLPPWLLLLGVLIFTLLVRGAILYLRPSGLSVDTDLYRVLAENVRDFGVFGDHETPSAYRPPLYPLVLATLPRVIHVSAPAIGLLHLVIGLATVALVFQLAKEWQLGPLAWLPAVVVACDPILLVQSVQIMSETLATLLAVVGLWMLTRFSKQPTPLWAAAVGASLALATLCRPVFVVWLLLVIPVVLLQRLSWKERTTNVALFLLASLIVVGPWAWRNQKQFGRPIFTTTHGGYTLLLANNRDLYRYYKEDESGLPWSPQPDYSTWVLQYVLENPGDDELAFDAACYTAAKECIGTETRTFAYSCLVRVGSLWGILPRQVTSPESVKVKAYRYTVALWYLLIFTLAAVGVFIKSRELVATPWLWGVLLCVSFTMVHAVYWSNLRMRGPIMPVVALLAAAGLAYIWARSTERK